MKIIANKSERNLQNNKRQVIIKSINIRISYNISNTIVVSKISIFRYNSEPSIALTRYRRAANKPKKEERDFGMSSK